MTYATWDVSRATDEHDGLPDRRIVPLIERLRERGVVTLQSCSGHQGESDGHLWVRADSVDEQSVRRIARSPFSYVRRRIWPDDVWEFGWIPEVSVSAIALLGIKLEPYARRPGGEP